jgi:hypothetical protein
LHAFYHFSIVDRNDLLVELSNSKGVKIENNLTIDDLYSFDVSNDKYRRNFEKIFQVYEDKANIAIPNIVSEIKDASNKYQQSLRDIYGYKIFNSLRNPYLIKKTLKKFSFTENLWPSEPELMETCFNVFLGNKPQSSHLCNEFNISYDDYKKWLKMIYFLLSVHPHDRRSQFDGLIDEFFNAPDYVCFAFLYHFTDDSADKVVLLQDNTNIELSVHNNSLSNLFNVSSKMLLSVSFLPFSKVISETGLPKTTPIQNLHQFTYKENDFEMLSNFNRACLVNANNSVYCASNVAYGIKIK